MTLERRPDAKAIELEFDRWLTEATADELFWFVAKVREHVASRIDVADAHGDGPLVNALCWVARQHFSPGPRW
jgi:hypothetical protein